MDDAMAVPHLFRVKLDGKNKMLDRTLLQGAKTTGQRIRLLMRCHAEKAVHVGEPMSYEQLRPLLFHLLHGSVPHDLAVEIPQGNIGIRRGEVKGEAWYHSELW